MSCRTALQVAVSTITLASGGEQVSMQTADLELPNLSQATFSDPNSNPPQEELSVEIAMLIWNRLRLVTDIPRSAYASCEGTSNEGAAWVNQETNEVTT